MAILILILKAIGLSRPKDLSFLIRCNGECRAWHAKIKARSRQASRHSHEPPGGAFAGTLRSPPDRNALRAWVEAAGASFWRGSNSLPASHEPPGGASREPCAHLRSKCASRMGGGSEFEKPVSIAKNNTTTMSWCYFGAGDEARTRYLHLGKVALYQMSYARGTLTIIADSFVFVKPYFSFFRRFWFCRLANAEKL